jgi:hypothetical protein
MRSSWSGVPVFTAAIVCHRIFNLSTYLDDVQCSLVGYSRLVMFSFGFQQAYQRGLKAGDDVFFSKVSHLGLLRGSNRDGPFF